MHVFFLVFTTRWLKQLLLTQAFFLKHSWQSLFIEILSRNRTGFIWENVAVLIYLLLLLFLSFLRKDAQSNMFNQQLSAAFMSTFSITLLEQLLCLHTRRFVPLSPYWPEQYCFSGNVPIDTSNTTPRQDLSLKLQTFSQVLNYIYHLCLFSFLNFVEHTAFLMIKPIPNSYKV